jgi:hypothetical protein
MTPLSTAQLPLSTATSLPAFLKEEFTRDTYLVNAGLQAGYVTLDDLNPTCAEHREGFEASLQNGPYSTRPLPREWLEVLSPYRLWANTQNSSITTYMTEELQAMDWSGPDWEKIPQNIHLGIPGHNVMITETLPEPLYTALLEKCRAYPHVTMLNSILAHSLLSRHRTEIQHLLDTAKAAAQERRRQAEADEAAAIAAARQEARKKSRKDSTERRKGQEPLLLAIGTGKAHLVARFKLEALEPVAAVLPTWLAAPADIRALLIRVPGITLETQLASLDAWESVPDRSRNDLPPLPKTILRELKTATLTAVLEEDLHCKRAVVTPALTAEDIDSLLLGPLLADPDQATIIQQGYALGIWLDEVQATVPSQTPQYPDDPEAAWLQTILKHGNERSFRTRAQIVRKLWSGWTSARRAALASFLIERLQNVPLIPDPTDTR